MNERFRLTDEEWKEMQELLRKGRTGKLAAAEIKRLARLIRGSGGLPEFEINDILQRHGFADLKKVEEAATSEAIGALIALGLGIAGAYLLLKALGK